MIHIHNGEITAAMARRANIPGRHVPFRDMLVAGPVPAGGEANDWIEQRARFLSENYEQHLLRVRNELRDQEQLLEEAKSEDEIVLWFEHDLFCLINLLYLMVRLAKARHLTVIWCPTPLGTASAEDIPKFFHSRAAVSPAMSRAAADAWNAYTSADASELNRFIAADNTPDFPFLRDGLLLHASRFPSTANGLGEVERRAMEGIAAGAGDFMSLFARFDQNPPRFGLGDGEFLRHLRRLATSAVPMITINEVEGETPPKALFALTPAGQNVLEAKADFIDLNNAGFWLGGVYVDREHLWRWNPARREIVWSGAVH